MLHISLVIWNNLLSALLRERDSPKQIMRLWWAQKSGLVFLFIWLAGEGNERIGETETFKIYCNFSLSRILQRMIWGVQIRHKAYKYALDSSLCVMAVSCQSKWCLQIWGHAAERTYRGITMTHTNRYTQDSSLTGMHLSRITMRSMAISFASKTPPPLWVVKLLKINKTRV